jgi:hypothetical protein
MNTFWTAIGNYTPTGVVTTRRNTGRKIDEATGKATGVWTESTEQSVTGTGLGNWSAASGACITWHTNAFINGKEVRGRTFIVPLAGNTYSAVGGISSTVANAIQTAANNLRIALGQDLRVWARPFEGRDASGTPGQPGYKPAIPARVGTSWPISTVVVHTQGAVLRSRRD